MRRTDDYDRYDDGYRQGDSYAVSGSRFASMDADKLAFVQRVYNIFLGGLAATALMAALFQKFLTLPQLGSVMGPASILHLIFWVMLFFQRRAKGGFALFIFAGFTTTLGVTTACVAATYGQAGMGALVASAFGVTAAAFGALSLYVHLSGTNFSYLRGFLMMGVVAMIGVTIMSLFIDMEPFAVVISGFAVLLMCGFVLYDTSQVTRSYYQDNNAIMAALMLYWDFILMFRYVLMLLHALGRR